MNMLWWTALGAYMRPPQLSGITPTKDDPGVREHWQEWTVAVPGMIWCGSLLGLALVSGGLFVRLYFQPSPEQFLLYPLMYLLTITGGSCLVGGALALPFYVAWASCVHLAAQRVSDAVVEDWRVQVTRWWFRRSLFYLALMLAWGFWPVPVPAGADEKETGAALAHGIVWALLLWYTMLPLLATIFLGLREKCAVGR